MHAPNARFRSVVLIWVSLVAGCHEVIPCDDEVGVCPRPDVEVVVNDGGFVKSIWIEEPEITVTLGGSVRTMCRGDLDAAPGEEIIFRGDYHFMVLRHESAAPRILSRVPSNFFRTRLIDIEGDGNVAYLEHGSSETVRLWSHAGDMLWEVKSDSDKAPPFWASRTLWLDTNGNGSLDFLVGTDHGVELRSAAGTLLATIGSLPYWRLVLGQFDEDPDWELATLDYDSPVPPPGRFHRISTFDLDGTPLGSFSSPDRETDDLFEWFYPVADPNTPGVERIAVECTLYDPAGNEVGVLERNEYGSCYVGRDIIGADVVETDCATDTGLVTEPFGVRFSPGSEPYRVEMAHSFARYDFHDFVTAGSRYDPKRTILKIVAPDGALVYHEVLGSKSGPGSFVVMPSQVDGAEILLLADDSVVWAYSLPP